MKLLQSNVIQSKTKCYLKSCNPDIVYRDYESTVFQRKDDYQPAYDSHFPTKSDGEFLIEKSTSYAGTNATVINAKAVAMNRMNPNLKIFASMIDPVQ